MNHGTVHRMNRKLTHRASSLHRVSSLALLASIAFTGAFTGALTGCQSVYNGQVLPSGHYRADDVQYFAPGPEFKLAREAAAMEEQRAAIESVPQNR